MDGGKAFIELRDRLLRDGITPEEAERIFKALSEKGTVTMPIEETFWATRFGMLIDQFGTPWMINCEKKMA